MNGNHDEQDERVPAHDKSMRYVFLFADKGPQRAKYRLTLNSIEEINPYPFELVDSSRSAYLCIFCDPAAHNRDSPLMFGIEWSNPHKRHKDIYSVVQNRRATPKMDMESKTWTIPIGKTYLFVDFHNYGAAFLGFGGISKDDHYATILESILRTLFKLLGNRRLSPRDGFYLISKTFVHFSHHCLLQRHRADHIATSVITEHYLEIKNVNSWNDMSIALICLASLWFLPQRTKSIGYQKIAETLHALHIRDRGSPIILLQNLRRIFSRKIVLSLEKRLTNKIQSERQQSSKYNYAAFYNLLHCACADPKVENIKTINNSLLSLTDDIDHLFQLAMDNLAFISLNRAIPLEQKLVFNLAGKDIDLAFKYDFVKRIMDKLPEIEDLLSFLESCQHDLITLLRFDTEYWLAFVHYVIERCGIPFKRPVIDLQLSGFETQTMTLISSMFCHKVVQINGDHDSQSMYTLCTDYPIVMDGNVRQSIMDNEYLLSQSDFFPFIDHLVRPQFAPDTWQQNLTKFIGGWIKYRRLAAAIDILKEHNLDLRVFERYCTTYDVSEYVPGEMENKFKVMCEPMVPNKVRTIVAQRISAPWHIYGEDGRNHLIDGCVYLMTKGLELEGAEAAVLTILNNVISEENPFDDDNDVLTTTYLVSDVGKSFIKLLRALKRIQHNIPPIIEDRIEAFHQFWHRTVQHIGTKQSQIAVALMVWEDQCTKEDTIDEAFTQTGGIILDEEKEKCDNVLSDFATVVKWKVQVDLLFETFAPSQQYWDNDIQALYDVHHNLKHWHKLKLHDMLSKECTLVSKFLSSLDSDQMEKLGESKICVSIWRTFVSAEEAKWNLKEFRGMGNYEVVDWIRSIGTHLRSIAPEFDIETLVQILYDKELTGRHLQSKKLTHDTFSAWLTEWNQQQNNGPETISDHTIKTVTRAFFEQLELRLKRDAECRTTAPRDKIFSFKKLGATLDQLKEKWGRVKQQIIENTLNVETVQQYFGMLKTEDANGVFKELSFALHSYPEHEQRRLMPLMESSARSIVMVFDSLSTLESAKIARDAAQLFQKILREAPQSKRQNLSDDGQWKERMDLMAADYTKRPVARMDLIARKVQQTLISLDETQQKWLSIILSNRKCITQLYTKFHDAAEFEKHMQIFGTSDPIRQSRAMALMSVRSCIVSCLNVPMKSMTDLSERLRALSQSITPNDVRYLEIVVTSWNKLLVDTFDATQYKFQQDKDTLAQLTQFTFLNEVDQTEDGLQYLQAVLGEAKQDEELQMQQILTQNEFDAFTDRLLMFIASERGDVDAGDAPIRSISEMKTRDVVNFLKPRKHTFAQCGMPFADLEQLLEEKNVTGSGLMAAYEAAKNKPEAMHEFLFGDEQVLDMKKEENISFQIFKVIDSQILKNEVQDDIIPKFDLCKKIAKHRLLYYSGGGRAKLDQNRRIDLKKSMEDFEQIERDWEQNVLDWKQEIEKLRKDFKVLTFFTVNDMRWIMEKIQQYINRGEDAEKEKYLRELHSVLCFIDPNLGLEDCRKKVTVLWQQRQPHTMQELGEGLKSAFGERLRECIPLTLTDYQYLAPGKPHLFYCQQIDAILRTVMKLFLSQQQQPAASRVLFCSQQTTLEEVECLLMRSNLGSNRSAGNLLLHVLVQPERLHPEIQDEFLRIITQYVYKNGSLFAIVTSDTRNKIYHQLSAFVNYTQRPLTEKERRLFLKEILCSDPEEFHTKNNEGPLCAVYLSQTECVGKSHVIRLLAKEKGHTLVHVPINTRTMDLDFIVDRLMSVPKQESAKTVFHINVSSDAGREVNEVMFQLLVLRYLKKSSGASFNVNSNHAFLVELPSQIASTLKQTNIDDVLEYFHFLAGSKSFGISKFEVQDALRPCNPIIEPQRVISNRLVLSSKEMFVLKYLDAFAKKKLVITGKVQNNWDHSQHPDIDVVRQRKLIAKYCQQGAGSLVFLKSFLRYMYRQLIQLYTASAFVKNELSVAVDGGKTFIQYHMVIAESMIQSAPHIACHMYQIPQIIIQQTVNEKNMDETTGEEEFFLVKYWSKTQTPMVLMNQRSITEAHMLHLDATSLAEDIETAAKANECTFSLLAMNLDKSKSYGASQWRLYRKVNSVGRTLKWNLYNFEQDRTERLRQLKEQGFANETSSKQKEKLRLLMRICGGFVSNDPEKQEAQLSELYNANKDYALTFDNILKIVAIFFRVNSGIPVLIMGETGCGKTKLLSFMSIALGIKMFSIDVHGGYSIVDLQRDLTRRDRRDPQVDEYDPGPIQYAADHPHKTVLVFLDEVNTSPDVGGFKEVICDHSLKGEEFPANMVIIAALNPYRKRHKTKEQLEEERAANANNPKYFVDDLDREMGSLVYRVFPLPPSLKTYVWNFGALSQMDEQQYIAVMTRTTWDDPEFLRECPDHYRAFTVLRNCFIDFICKSQQFLRIELNDKSVCSLRDVRRANRLFLWFFHRQNHKNRTATSRILESMILAIAQCYYYRLNQRQRNRFEAKIESAAASQPKIFKTKLKFKEVIDAQQWQYVHKLKIETGIAKNRAFRENLFVMLVGIATETPTIIVGRPGSSKTLAMVTLQNNLSSSTKNEALTKMGFDDYFVVPFQCSKLTTAASIQKRWEFAEEYEMRLNERRDKKKTLKRKVILFLDEVGLAEQSPHRPLKVLHKLLENPDIAFIGLSNWALDSAKMNRVVLHNVLSPSEEDLIETADKIMKGGDDGLSNASAQLQQRIPKIAVFYESILNDKKHNPFGFDFFGHRDFYNLVSYLKFRLQQRNVSLKDDSVLVEAILRNFGGETKQQAEEFLLPKIAEYIKSIRNLDRDQLWCEFNPLSLIRDNIRQSKDSQRCKTYELRNILLIADSPMMWKILFDANILQIADTEIVFGSKFKKDTGSTIYLYRTIERVRGAMHSGRVCVLLKLDQLYDSLYDVLNQRYLNVDNQKFCKICIGGESISCQIHHAFRCIVVQSRGEAHHLSKNTDDWTPVAFLNRFEKQYLDPGVLQQYGIGDGWSQKWKLLESMINRKYKDHLAYRNKDLFIGFNKTYSFVSLLTTEAQSDHIEHKEEDEEDEWVFPEEDDQKVNVQESIDECYNMLLRSTSIEYLMQDQEKLRKQQFIPFASLIDLLQREGVQPESTRHMLLRVVTHDTYHLPLDFNYKLEVKDHDGARVKVKFDHDVEMDEKDEITFQSQMKDVHVLKFREITSFVRESDFYNYVYDFFNAVNSMENTLVIICDPANTNEQLVHYLHAQYLCEKARAAARRPNQDQGDGAKNIVFLIYMSRQTPYPLIFNREWKHLFLDALLPADYQMFPQIQVNDINIFEMVDQRELTEFEKRVIDHTDRIVFNSFERAMNNVGLFRADTEMGSGKGPDIRDEIERIKQLLNVDTDEVGDAGRLRKALVKRIQRVLIDKKSGAIDCLRKMLKDRKRSDRGSIRAHVMEKLAEKIRDPLAQILTITFSNGNSCLYHVGLDGTIDDAEDRRVSDLWLKLISEPRIVPVRIAQSGTAKNTRNNIDRSLNQAQFPFSSHIHSYMSSYKDDCLKAWNNDGVPVIESGQAGQIELSTELQNKLRAANLSVRIDNLPENLVRKLSEDIVKLEATRLGLQRHGAEILQHIIKFVHEFLWKSSNDSHEAVLQRKKPRKNARRNTQMTVNDSDSDESESDHDVLNIAEDSDDEDSEDVKEELDDKGISGGDNGEVKEVKEQEDDSKHDARVQDEEEEETTVQIHEIYATLWANEKIILQSVDVLFALKQSPTQLKKLNGSWTNAQTLPQCLGPITSQLLNKLEKSLKLADARSIQERATYLLAISQSFTDLFNFLESLGYDPQSVKQTKETTNILEFTANSVATSVATLFAGDLPEVQQMRGRWHIIRLAMICVSACPERIGGDFITKLTKQFHDHRFADLSKLGKLIQLMADALTQNAKKDDILQWFCQTYIRFFAFRAQDISEQFTQSLIEMIAEEKDQRNTDLNLNPNALTKFEVASQFLKKRTATKRNGTTKIEWAILERAVNQRELKSLIACLFLRAREQRLHHVMRSIYMGESIAAPKRKEVEAAANKLQASFENNTLDQVLAISECKVVLHYFVRYLQKILSFKGSIDEKGIRLKKKLYKKASYLKAIGEILMIPNPCSQNIRAIKQGLQYYFVSEIWNNIGAQNAMALMSKSVFSKVMNVELFKHDTLIDGKTPDCVPRDNIFKLYLSHDDEKMAVEAAKVYQQFEQSVINDTKPEFEFKRMHYVQLFGAIVNRAYLRGGSKQFQHIVRYINKAVNKDLKNEKAPHCKQRLCMLITNLITNNNWSDKLMEINSKKRTLEEIQMIRLCIHLVAVVLSLPPNPFSRLFHNPMDLVKEYVPGMPEDSSAALLKAMAGHGVWLCPNDHIYFVGNCTATNKAATCQECGAPIGNDVNKTFHNAAKGNRRLGKINEDGKIIPDKEQLLKDYGFVENSGDKDIVMAEYNSLKLAPKGYVMIEGVDDVVRGLNEISTGIVRWMINAILFVHGSELQTSKAGEFMKVPKDDVTKTLKKMMAKSLERLGSKLNQSFESVTYLMHQIIHNFCLRFHHKWGRQPIPGFTEPKMRSDFEAWLVTECIKPVTQNPMEVVAVVRKKVTKVPVLIKWGKRFGEQMDLKSPDGRTFAREYLPNIFLPFRLLTLSMFKERFLQSGSNKTNYPVTWGILNTIDTAAGYSVFALKHLPAMITWMKLLKQRLNHRLNLDEVMANPDIYSSQWVMDRCTKEGWGDINVWTDAFNGFVKGWNHLAERVTTQEDMENVQIDTVIKEELHQTDPNSDEKEENKQDGHDDQEHADQIKMIRKNQFKKFIKIANVCEALPIKPFIPRSAESNEENAAVKPKDVPLVFGMDSGLDGKLDSSIMIRKIVQHYVSVNNRVIGECHQLRDYDDEATLSKKQALGLDPALDSSYISRTEDVVDIDEEELRGMIQQCFQQKLRYGDAIPDAVNWRLLESRLRDRYITGRKFIFENPIYFEFAGQFNIPTVLQKIDRQHAVVLQADPEKEKYFEEAPSNLLELLKINLQQRAALNESNIINDDEHDGFVHVGGVDDRRNQQLQKQRQLDAYSNGKNAAEQTLVALQRQKHLPEKGYPLGTYMKDNLHLDPKEYEPFDRKELRLMHLGHIWRFLERLYLIEEGTWHKIPDKTMELYRNKITDELRTGIIQFIANPMNKMDDLWTFLSAFRRFLETTCRTQFSKNPNQESLAQSLAYAEDVDQELLNEFPAEIKLNQAGYAYLHAAKEYQTRNDRGTK